MSDPILETRIPQPTAARSALFLEGERLYLRGVTPEDVTDAYVRWMNDPEVTRYLESRFFPHSKEGIRSFVESLQGDRDNAFFAIVLKEGDRHIGNIKLGPINWLHRLGEIGLMIGEKDTWGKGYAAEAIRLISDYAFRHLNLHKVTAGCYGSNQGSARAFERAGFKVEGLRPQHFFCEGEYVDFILLGKVNA